jgi:transcriptional regulator with XRE-family HTH domain
MILGSPVSKDGESFGDRIRAYRLRAGLTPDQLAAAAGISIRTLREVEHGRVRSARARSVRRLTDVLDGRIREISEETGKPDSLFFRLLGSLAVFRGEIAVPIGSAKQRIVLAILGLQPNQVIGSEELIDALWGDRPPESCRGLVHTYVSRLRKTLGMSGVLLSGGGGYELRAGEEQLDVLRFRRLATAGLADFRDPDQAADLLARALRCWSGPLLLGAHDRLRHHPVAVDTARMRVDAAVRYAELGADKGDRAEEVVALLRRTAARGVTGTADARARRSRPTGAGIVGVRRCARPAGRRARHRSGRDSPPRPAGCVAAANQRSGTRAGAQLADGAGAASASDKGIRWAVEGARHAGHPAQQARSGR